MRLLTALGLAGLSGLLLLLSFPKFDLSLLAWIGLVPLLVALEGRGAGAAFLLANVSGLVFFVGIFAWIFQVQAYNLLDEVALALYLAQFFGLWGLGLGWLRARTGLPVAVIAPPLWVAMEYLRAHAGFLSLPWMFLGHSQYGSPALIQVASMTGVFGLSFLIVLVNVAAAQAIPWLARRPAHLTDVRAWSPGLPASLLVASGLLALTVIYGRTVLSTEPDGELLRVAVVQGNVPQAVKWDRRYREATLERYAALTREVARERPTLIVWPETAVPGDLQHDAELSRAIGALAAETRSHLLVGTSENAKFTRKDLGGRSYNSMVLLTPEGRVASTYHKIKLVPFGEYEPLRGIVTWPAAIVSTMGNSVAGDEYTLFRIGGATVATTICWENIFPDLVREFVRLGARLVVNATNEAWFGETAAAYRFLAISVFRAAENRVAVVRSANTGISAVIDPYGRITRRLRDRDGRELFVAGTLTATIPLARTTTFYTTYGDVFAVVQIAGCGLLLISAAVPRRRRAMGSLEPVAPMRDLH